MWEIFTQLLTHLKKVVLIWIVNIRVVILDQIVFDDVQDTQYESINKKEIGNATCISIKLECIFSHLYKRGMGHGLRNSLLPRSEVCIIGMGLCDNLDSIN